MLDHPPPASAAGFDQESRRDVLTSAIVVERAEVIIEVGNRAVVQILDHSARHFGSLWYKIRLGAMLASEDAVGNIFKCQVRAVFKQRATERRKEIVSFTRHDEVDPGKFARSR